MRAHLVDPVVISARLGTVDARYSSAIDTATRWIGYHIDHGNP